MVDAYLKIDVKEVNDLVYQAKREILATVGTLETRQKEIEQRMIELLKAVHMTDNAVALFNDNLKKVDILKIEFTQESWKRNMEHIDKMLEKMKTQTDLMMQARASLPDVTKEISNLTSVLYEVDKLVRNKAIQELAKGLQK